MQYDDIRSSLKDSSSTHYSNHYRQHDLLLAGLQTQVLKTYHLLVQQVRDYEQSHFKQYGILPNTLTPDWEEKYKKIKRIKALLRTWNIRI